MVACSNILFSKHVLIFHAMIMRTFHLHITDHCANNHLHIRPSVYRFLVLGSQRIFHYNLAVYKEHLYITTSDHYSSPKLGSTLSLTPHNDTIV